MFRSGRFLRNIKAVVTYPFWVLLGRPAPDNHVYKKRRVRSIGALFSCETFIETGSYYGQMTNGVKNHFYKVLSVELSEALYSYNKSSMSEYPHVRIYLGESSTRLQDMLHDARGRILFWLDAHYSGKGTVCGDQLCPILKELDLIGEHHRNDHCILIDDARLFNGVEGYPTLQETKARLLEINPNYNIYVDLDCIVALPGKKVKRRGKQS